MEATQTPPAEDPPSERTRTILAMQSQLQDVSEAVKEIKKMMQKQESWRAAAWRAFTQFVGDLKNGH